MGWWTINELGKELLQGDTPYDILGDAFEQIAKEYQKEWNRKPTLLELVQTMQSVLCAGAEGFFAEGDQLDIVKIAIKTKKHKKNKSLHAGDYFAISIGPKQYVFGRIVSFDSDMGWLIGIYDKVSRGILTLSTLKGSALMFPLFFYGGDALKRDRWKIIGNAPIQPDEFVTPIFKEGYEGFGWWIVDREHDQKRVATEEEVKGLEYATLYPTETVEYIIRKHLIESDRPVPPE